MGGGPPRRTFWALGYDIEILSRGDEEIFRTKIIESIEKKRPVIAYGIVGPPDEGIVARYEKNGQIMLGRSYFHDSSKGYFEKEDWYKDCMGLLFIGDRKTPPEKNEIFLESLKWSVILARTPKCIILSKSTLNHKHLLGFAAFDGWIDALKNDAYFPKDDMDELTLACQIYSSATLSCLFDSRRAAVGFLKSMVDEFQTGKNEIMKAISVYEEELNILSEGMKMVPFDWEPEEKRRQIADSRLRSYLANLILKAKENEIQAIAHIENALKKKKIDAFENPRAFYINV